MKAFYHTNVRSLREFAGHSQTEAAATVHKPRWQTWQKWESMCKLPWAEAELYMIKTVNQQALADFYLAKEFVFGDPQEKPQGIMTNAGENQ